MSNIQIIEVHGYKITYDSFSCEFCLEDALGNEVGRGKTQVELVTKAERLSKVKFNRLPAIRKGYHGLEYGEITSYNPEEKSAWFVSDKGERSKETFHHGPQCFERTSTNEVIEQKIEGLINQLGGINNEIDKEKGRLEKPITLEYLTAYIQKPTKESHA